MSNLSVDMAGVHFKNPIIPASGAFGFGAEYERFFPLSALGGISVKGMTLQQKDGNPPPRVAEAPAGMLNSVGLQNPGVDAFLEHELPRLARKGTVIIANIAGGTVEDCVEIARRLEGSAVGMLELNISCPNVKEGGVAFGVDPKMAGSITKAVRAATTKPLMVKLSPNVTDITVIARAVEAEGADAISLINTLLGMRIDLSTRRPVLKNNVGGLSGPAIFPIALRMVWQTANAVHIPVCGMGGVSTGRDAAEMMLAGATTVQVGAALFRDPMAAVRIIEELDCWLDGQGLSGAAELIGGVKPY